MAALDVVVLKESIAATHADKMYRGAKPADLPVEQPIKFELVIDLKTAGTLGFTIPLSAPGDEDGLEPIGYRVEDERKCPEIAWQLARGRDERGRPLTGPAAGGAGGR